MTHEQPSSPAHPVKSEHGEESARLTAPEGRIIAGTRPGRDAANRSGPDARAILALLARQPCTAVSVAGGLGLHLNEALKQLQALILSGDVVVVMKGGQRLYAARRAAP